ncbi:MAG: HemK/PrmC family methyltransferase, partial [Phycisphaerae bacterium]
MAAEPDRKPDRWTIGRLLKWTADYLDERGVDEPRLSAEVLLAHATRRRRIDLYARYDESLEQEPLTRFREWVRRAAEHEPIGYLVEEKEFFSLPFRVTPDVLIPRPETEVLVESAIDHCAESKLKEPRVLDVGTGSGCIAVAVLTQIPGARAVATDISSAALGVARENAERHDVSDRLTLVEADCL